jgi:hypothetical protein
MWQRLNASPSATDHRAMALPSICYISATGRDVPFDTIVLRDRLSPPDSAGTAHRVTRRAGLAEGRWSRRHRVCSRGRKEAREDWRRDQSVLRPMRGHGPAYRPLPVLLAAQPVSRETYKAPFELSGRKATQTRYRSLWKRMVFFCIRAHTVRLRGTSGNLSSLPFSPSAWQAIQSLWEAVSDTENDSSDHQANHQALPSVPSFNRGRRAESEVCMDAGRRRSEALESLTAAAYPDDSEAEDSSEGTPDSDATDNKYVQVSETELKEASCCSDDDGIKCQPRVIHRRTAANSEPLRHFSRLTIPYYPTLLASVPFSAWSPA